MAAQSMMVEAGVGGLVMVSETGNVAVVSEQVSQATSVATCPAGFQLISGDYELHDQNIATAPLSYLATPQANYLTDEYSVNLQLFSVGQLDFVQVVAIAHCGQLTFPMNMGMIGGELLDLDTLSLFIGAIGVNPVITGLVAITMGGVAAQAIWYFNSRRKNE